MASTESAGSAKVPCPFVYARGKRCTGHIVRVEAYKADLWWDFKDGRWIFSYGRPRSHFHLFCSEKGNHSGWVGPDNDQMKFYGDQLPDELVEAMNAAS
jgi:hypothetical protein